MRILQRARSRLALTLALLGAILAGFGLTGFGAPASAAEPPGAGSKYVAMGSSSASGPGITTPAAGAPVRCGRSADNYAHQLARRRGLALVDMTCSGATSEHILHPWRELPAQIEAVDADTRLVTVTIGGNDLGYMTGLYKAGCARLPPGGGGLFRLPLCPVPASPAVGDEAFAALEGRLRAIAEEIHRRAPAARLVFVDYPQLLPPSGTCALTPLSDAEADAVRTLARRLAELTARVARETGADLLQTSRLSQGHDACAKAPWMSGFPSPGHPVAGVPYHPNLAGMTAVADGLDRLLWR